MSAFEAACPITTAVDYTREEERGERQSCSRKVEWHRTTYDLIRLGVVTNRATASCRLPPKGLADLGFKRLTLNPLDHFRF